MMMFASGLIDVYAGFILSTRQHLNSIQSSIFGTKFKNILQKKNISKHQFWLKNENFVISKIHFLTYLFYCYNYYLLLICHNLSPKYQD